MKNLELISHFSTEPIPRDWEVSVDQPKLIKLTAASAALSGALAFGCIMVAAAVLAFTQMQYRQQQRLDDTQRVKLEQAEHLYEQGRFLSCTQEMKNFLVSEKSSLSIQPEIYERATRLYGDCQSALVADADQLALQGRFKDAIIWIRGIAADSPDAAQRIQQWSGQILSIAERYYNQGELESAINVLNAIPPDNSAYSEAQFRKQRWQEEWANNLDHLQKARAAFASGHLDTAYEEVEKLTAHPAFQAQKREIQQRIEERWEAQRQWLSDLPWIVAAGASSFMIAAYFRASARYQ